MRVRGVAVSTYHAGTIAFAGRPNAGKSTLLNRILGQKIAITSHKPQTTRNRIVGIHTSETCQFIMVDTPGIHPATSRMNRAMVQAATTSLADVDIVCIIMDASRAAESVSRGGKPLSKGDLAVARMAEQAGARHITVVLNKIDLVDKKLLLPVMQAWGQRFPGAEIVPLSALKRDGIDTLLGVWQGLLPESPALYPEEMITEQSEQRFIVSEIVREKLFLLTEKELPYSVAVEVESFDDHRESDRPKVIIHARILVERESQKAIVIGKGGSMLKKVGTMARKEIQRLLDAAVHIDLHVVVRKEWTESPVMLKTFGFDD